MLPPSWWGYTSAHDQDRTDRLIPRLKRGGYLPPGHPSFVELAEKADKRLFNAIVANPTHVLSKYLPNIKTTGHNLRPRGHRFELPEKEDSNFMSRLLYSSLELIPPTVL